MTRIQPAMHGRHQVSRLAAVAVALLVTVLVMGIVGASASASPTQTDVMFVFDTSGSMEPVLEEAKAEIKEVMAQLEGSLPNVEFGVAEARDYGESEYDSYSDQPWKLDAPVTSDVGQVNQAISDLSAFGGGDGPEAYGRALWETDTNPDVGWRPGARHLIVLVADQVPHNPNVDEGIPEEFWIESSPWDTGEELSGTWGIPGTRLKEGETLDFHAVLRQLASDGTPLEMVDYHDTEGDFIHYWEYWAHIAGGTAVEASEHGNELAAKLKQLVEGAGVPCATSAVPEPPSPATPGGPPTVLTPRFLQPGSAVVLTPPAGSGFCKGQLPELGHDVVTGVEEATSSKLAFRVPPTAASRLALTTSSGAPGPQEPYGVDNFRYPWGFNIINTTGDGGGGTYDDKVTITPQDLDSVFSGLGPPGSPEYLEAEEDAEDLLKEVGLCYGFGLLSWALYGDAHGQHIPLTYAASSGFKPTPGTEPYLLDEQSGGAHSLTRALLRGAVSQVSPEAKSTWLSVSNSGALATQLNSAFSTGQPALLLINFPFQGGEHGHTLLAYNYQRPDPTTGEGIAVDVVDPNIPWSEGRPPSDYEKLQVHVRNNGSWTFSATAFGLGDFGAQVGGGSGSLEVVPHPKIPGGLELHTTLSGGPSPISVTPPIGAHVTAIGYSGAAGTTIPSDVKPEAFSDDAVDTRLLVPPSHHELTISYSAPSGTAGPLHVTGRGFLDTAALVGGGRTVTVDASTGSLSTPVATTGTVLSVTSLVRGEQLTAEVRFSGRVRRPTLEINGAGEVSLRTAGGGGQASLSLATFTEAGEQAHTRDERLSLRGRAHIHRHTPKIKRHRRRRTRHKKKSK
jgi:hypothetical protein